MRNIIFISHATPEDNDFSIWLASRLKLLGYNVWVDKNELLGGEKSWEEIDQVIRCKATKFLLIYSKNICIKGQMGKLKDGIYKEYSLAENISKQDVLKDFIILLNIDNSTFSLFIGADRLTQIPVHKNWADGLKQLIKKLEKDKVEKSDKNTDLGFAHWYENKYTIKNDIIQKNELYYSNWWPIQNLPEFFYIYQFETESQAQELKRKNPYPLGKIANNLSSFDPEFSMDIEHEGQKRILKPKSIHKIKVSDVLLGFEKADFPTHKDVKNHFIRLLSRIFHQIMKNHGMRWYEMANKKLAYFYTPANLKSLKSSFEYPSRTDRRKKKKKTLIGKYLSLGKWHFAISSKPILSPFLGFSLKTHITFTVNGFNVWEDKGKIHIHRRSKGKRFFNEEWRDMFFAFLNGLKNHEGKIELPLSSQFTLCMKPWTELYWADFGYYEPADKERQAVLDQHEEIEMEEDSQEENKVTDQNAETDTISYS